MLKSQELAERLAVKTRELFQFNEEVIKRGVTPDDIEEGIRRDKELNDIEDERVKAAQFEEIEKKTRERHQMLSTPVDSLGHSDGARPTGDQKSLGELFTGSAQFKHRQDPRNYTVDLPEFDFTSYRQLKTTMTTAAGWAPANPRTNIVIPLAQRRPVVADLIPQDPTTLSAIKYMLETTNTNAADVVGEGSDKPESALAFTEETSNVYKIATILPVSEEQIEDVPQAQAVINNRLALMLQLAEEVHLLTGDGSSDIDGFLHISGVQTQAKSTDPTPTAIYKAMNVIRSGGSTPGYAEPDGVVMHPNDWVDIATLQDGVGRYVWGDPYNAGVERIWGKPVIITPAETENTALVGDFGLYAHISRRVGANIRVYDQYSDYPKKNLLLMVAEERLSLEIYRPAAFCKVTGI